MPEVNPWETENGKRAIAVLAGEDALQQVLTLDSLLHCWQKFSPVPTATSKDAENVRHGILRDAARAFMRRHEIAYGCTADGHFWYGTAHAPLWDTYETEDAALIAAVLAVEK